MYTPKTKIRWRWPLSLSLALFSLQPEEGWTRLYDYRDVGRYCSAYINHKAKREVNKGRISCSSAFPDASERKAVMTQCRVLLSQSPPVIICSGRGYAKMEDNCKVSMTGDKGKITCK